MISRYLLTEAAPDLRPLLAFLAIAGLSAPAPAQDYPPEVRATTIGSAAADAEKADPAETFEKIRAASSDAPGSTELHLRITPEDLPPRGLCRAWVPGMPAEAQMPPNACDKLRSALPEGAILLVGGPVRDSNGTRQTPKSDGLSAASSASRDTSAREPRISDAPAVQPSLTEREDDGSSPAKPSVGTKAATGGAEPAKPPVPPLLSQRSKVALRLAPPAPRKPERTSPQETQDLTKRGLVAPKTLSRVTSPPPAANGAQVPATKVSGTKVPGPKVSGVETPKRGLLQDALSLNYWKGVWDGLEETPEPTRGRLMRGRPHNY